MTNELEIILVGILVCACLALPGVFLVLRGMSMMTDAISHTVLLGIVIGYFISKDLSSPWLFVCSIIMGIFTVWFTELIYRTKLVHKDSAIGLVFPLFFSIGVILISKFAKNVHLDVEHILFGEIAFAPFDRFETDTLDFGPKSLIITGIIFLLNLVLIMLFYKELKVSTFDEDYAKTIGLSPMLIHYLLMTLVSISSVGTFRSVGVILVISFMVGPPLTARLLTDKLSVMLILSIIIGAVDSVIGYLLAIYFDVSISGMQATVVGVVFLLTLALPIKKGIFKRKN